MSHHHARERVLYPLSASRSAGDLVFVSGTVGRDPDTGEIPDAFDDQVRLAFRSLEAELIAQGASLGSVLRTTVYLTSQADFPVMNELYASFFAPPWPARTTLVTALALPALRFEIECIATRGES